MSTVYIGLGANLCDPIEQLQRAVIALEKIVDTQLECVSKFYGSKPMGPQDQPDYVNAVAKLTTSLAPEQLLNELQHIELQQGRARKNERWGPRTLDLDILLFANQVINTERLTVPHYGLCDREFVVYPLLELDEHLSLPDGRTLLEISKHIPLNGLTPLN